MDYIAVRKHSLDYMAKLNLFDSYSWSSGLADLEVFVVDASFPTLVIRYSNGTKVDCYSLHAGVEGLSY